MKILSLFDGMACGMIAMKMQGINVERYEAFEIDKYAIKTALYNFPEIHENGDVFEGDYTKFKGFDFLIGGSICTQWSIAQKNDRETEPYSGIGWELFSQYVRALKEAKPKYFIYENNKSMSNAIRDEIRKTFGFEEICINSALVSAQNRNRYYWVGKRNDDGSYSKVDVNQPEDLGILLKDILDSVIPLTTSSKGKSFCLTASDYKGSNPKQTIEKHKRAMVAQPVRVGDLPNGKGEISGSQATRIYDINGKSVNLVANGGGQGAKTGLYAIPIDEKENCNDKKKLVIYEVKNGNLIIKNNNYPIKLPDGYYVIRNLSVNECKKLQTVPEWYEFPVSNTQAYKMLGNGWTCDVITHLIKSCIEQ